MQKCHLQGFAVIHTVFPNALQEHSVGKLTLSLQAQLVFELPSLFVTSATFMTSSGVSTVNSRITLMKKECN